MAVSPSRSLPPVTHRRSAHYTSTATSAMPSSAAGKEDLLQNRLRQLLVCDGSTEELCLAKVAGVDQMAPLSPPAEYAAQPRCHKSLPDLHCRGEPSSNKSSNKSLSNRDSGGSSGHYTQRSEPAPPPKQVNTGIALLLLFSLYLLSIFSPNFFPFVFSILILTVDKNVIHKNFMDHRAGTFNTKGLLITFISSKSVQ